MRKPNHHLPDDLPIPQAKPAFQQELEEALIARMKQKETKKMILALPVRNERLSVTITLIAAMLVLVLAVTLFGLMSRSPAPLNTLTAQQTTPTMIANDEIGTHPVVMTTRAVNRGEPFTADILTIVFWTNQSRPTHTFDNLEAVIGQVAIIDIPAYSPVMRDVVTESLCNEDGCPSIPIRMTAPSVIILPIEAPDPAQGRSINIYAVPSGTGMRLSDTVPENARLLAENKPILFAGTLAELEEYQRVMGLRPLNPPENMRNPDQNVVLLMASPQEIFVLADAFNDDTPLIVVPIDASNTPLIVTATPLVVLPTNTPNPEATREVLIPNDSLILNTLVTPKVGDQVNVIVALMFVDVEDTENPEVEPSVTMGHVSATARITAMDGNSVTLAVTPQEAVTFQYYVESRIPMMLIP
jgi:hypothetical protein